uniref:metallophosphoesterase n=1 Tax=Acetatifactor sp. TaxID=1872090 RepID=UPI004056BF82
MKRLERVYREAERCIIDKNSKIVCMSDCHRGVGERGDNFLPNKSLFVAALQYYYVGNFCYIELGDGDELWENSNLNKIAEIHSDVFRLLNRFYQKGCLKMLYGNHDCQKKSKAILFPELYAREGIVLTDCESGHEIFLVHGHQDDFLNDTLWPLAAFLVRFIWKPLEMLGVADPTSAARNYKKQKKAEQRLENFSEKNNILLIAGHTHRPILPMPGESLYLNDGSCVHPGGITAMEIERGAITLVKWCTTVRRDNLLTVSREVLEGPIPWKAYWKA